MGRSWARWGRGRERRQESQRKEGRRRLGSTLVEALEASLEQPSPHSQYRWMQESFLVLSSAFTAWLWGFWRVPNYIQGEGTKSSYPNCTSQVRRAPDWSDWFPGSMSLTRCQLKGRQECGRESQSWEGMRLWFSTGTKMINFAKLSFIWTWSLWNAPHCNCYNFL